MRIIIFLMFFFVSFNAFAAVFKHEGLSNGQKVVEWFSENSDASLSNPYPDGRYPNLTFRTAPATASETATYDANKADGIKRDANLTRRQQLQAALATWDTLTAAQQKAVLKAAVEMMLNR